MNTPLNTIINWFKTGEIPTEAQFKSTFLAFYHKDDPIPRESIEGLKEILQSLVEKGSFEEHLNDPQAHSRYLALLNAANLNSADVNSWKNKLGISNAATTDSSDQTGTTYTKIQINDFVDALKNADKDLALKIENIRKILLSNDLSLDELQEIIDFIKKSRNDFEDLKAGLSEDKIKILHDYNGLSHPKNQQEFNRQIHDKVILISETRTSAVVQVKESAVFPNILETENVIIQARDSVTGQKINVDDYATNQTIEVKILGEIVYPINILILKVKP